MKRKNIFRYIILPILILSVAIGWYLYSEYNRTHKDTAVLNADYSLPATNLINEFTTDEQATNKRYWNKILEVSGLVKEINQDDKKNYTIVLGDTASMSSVRCNIDSTHTEDVAGILKGDFVTVKGICTGFNADELLGSDVILIRCVVNSKKK